MYLSKKGVFCDICTIYLLFFKLKMCIGFCVVQHVLIKPEVKGLDNEVAGPPPSEPK